MINVKKISVAGLILLLVGIVGAISTFSSINEADKVVEEKVIKDNQFTNIDITTDNARIEILPTDGTTTNIELIGNKVKYDLKANVEDSTLAVHLKYRQTKLFNFGFTPRGLSLIITVPEKTYNSLKVESNNGLINIEKLKATNLYVTTDNGRIDLKDIEGSTVSSEAKNGRIDLINVLANTVKVRASNGKIYLDDVEGQLIGKSNNGSISLITNSMDRPIEFATNNGEITIETEKKPTNATIDTSIDNGKVSIFGHSDEHAEFGNGKNLIKLSANNGKITVSN